MPSVFGDALHYIAVLIADDDLHEKAMTVAVDLANASFVTSDAVLVEVLAYVCARGDHSRRQAVRLVELLREDSGTTIVPQTRELFDRGLDLYARRPDKAYSLTDTISMVICADYGITQVLTHDHHFAQEGFEVLL